MKTRHAIGNGGAVASVRGSFRRVLFVLLALIPVGRIHAQGSLDTAFNSTGKVQTTINANGDKATGVAIQSDGKIIVAGTATVSGGSDFYVARYTTAGVLDGTFGTGGIVTASINASDTTTGVAIQSDGKIVVCGYTYVGSKANFAVLRFTTAGALDTTFNTTGKVMTSISANSDLCNAIGIQGDGKIVVAGYTNSITPLFCAVRYTTAGALDTTFNSTGIATVSAIGSNGDQAYGMTIQSDGKIVIVGGTVNTTNFDWALARLTTAGALDTTFNGTGKLITSNGSSTDLAFAVAQQSDGKLVVTGYASNGSNDDIVTIRYSTGGAFDTIFPTTTFSGTSHERGQAVAIQSDGKILLAGFTNSPGNYDFALVRFTTAGALDTTFNSTGKVITAFGTNSDQAAAIKLQSDGRIVVAGFYTDASFVNHTAVARYLAAAPAPDIIVEQPAGTALTDNVSTVAFGTTSTGTSLTRTFKIINTGNADLTSLAVNKDGTNAADFSVGSLSSTTVTPSSTATFDVTFTPSTIGAKIAAIHIASNVTGAKNPFDINLTGTGAILPEIVIEQPAGTGLTDNVSSVNFGSAVSGSSTAAKVFTIKNIGTADLTGIAIAKDGTNAAEFTVDATGMLTTILAGQSTTFSVTATPSGGGTRSAAIHVASNDADENPFDIALTVTGLVPQISVEQPAGTALSDGVSTVSYGLGITGASSTKTFTIKNTGTADLTGLSLTKDGTNSGDYSVDATGMSTTIIAGGSTTFTVTFTPAAIGTRTAAIHIANNDGPRNPFDIALTGEGVIPSQAAQQAYAKASNPGASDVFGTAVAISGDTMVIGAYGEDSAATGVNGIQNDNTSADAGAAYVFVRSGGVWSQQAYLKASNTNVGDQFGFSVAISGDTIVVGANQEDSAATGINGNQNDNSATSAGAVYVFTRSGTTWLQQAYLKASNTNAQDNFGYSVGISGDTIIVGAYGESSNATTINGNQADNSAAGAGAAYIFTRSGGIWSQQAYLKASNAETGDSLGWSVAISGDTAVVGAINEDSNATGSNGNQANNSASSAGAAYVFVRSGGVWSQQAYLKASNPEANDMFGWAIAISGDTVVVGSYGEDSAATGINGNQSDNSALLAGAAYVFARSGTTWTQQAYLKASNTGAGDGFGTSLGVSGETIIVGGSVEASSATGINGDGSNNSAASAGAAYVFARAGSTWVQQAYLKSSNTGAGDRFGSAVAISGDTAVVGAFGEASNATGVNGNQADNSLATSGAAYVFTGLGPADITIEQPVGTVLVTGGVAQDFGSVLTGSSSAAKTFTISNAGTGSLLGLAVTKDGANAGEFTVDTTGMSTALASGQSTTFTVTFSPAAGGARSAAIHIGSNDLDENPFDISLAGTGVLPVPVLGVEQPAGTALTSGVSTVAFGSSAVAAPVAKTFTVKNTGTAALSLGSITKDGTDAADFSVGSLGSPLLSPGASTTFTVTFTPSAAGSKSAAIHLPNGDAARNPFDIALTGTGLDTPATLRQQYFGTTSNSGDAADNADPDHDGLANLLEFAFGLNPTEANASGALPQPAPNGGNFGVSFTQPANVTGITYGAVYSVDLVNWFPVTDTGTANQHVFSVPIGANSDIFMRLVVSSP